MSDNLDEPVGPAVPPDEARSPGGFEPADDGRPEPSGRGRWLALAGIAAAAVLTAGVVAAVSGGDGESSTTARTTPSGTDTTVQPPPRGGSTPVGVDPSTPPPSDETAPPGTDDTTDPPQRDAAIVPYLVAFDEVGAVAQLTANGWKVEVVEQTVLDPAQDGLVVDQIPAAGTELKRGSAITLMVNRLAEPGQGG